MPITLLKIRFVDTVEIESSIGDSGGADGGVSDQPAPSLPSETQPNAVNAPQAQSVGRADIAQPNTGAAASSSGAFDGCVPIDRDYPESLPTERRAHALEVLGDEVAQCQRCPKLAEARTKTVFGIGNPQPRVVFLGEAPGADEDRSGLPFVGAAGQLLDKILEASSFAREDVYIMNTLKCRPPGNRNPNEEEIDRCRGYWQRQLELLQPEYIVCLGAVSVRTLLQIDSPIGRLRGRFHQYRGSKVVATYHPAYLLRQASAKRLVWDDMKMLMADMGIPVPPRKNS